MKDRTRDTLGQLLLRGFKWFDQGLLNRLHAKGFPELRRSHSLVVAHLDSGGTRIAELARRIGVSRQAMHETVGELRRAGLVELVADPTNRSAKLVVMTEEGRRSVRAARRIYADLERELASRLGPEQAAELRRALESDWGAPT